jgi:hypothetical protein
MHIVVADVRNEAEDLEQLIQVPSAPASSCMVV